MFTESFLKRVLMFIGIILSGLITLIFVSTPESLQVPVPDQLPPITTKSALARDFAEAKQFFEAPVVAQVAGASFKNIVSWSPNGRYIVANLRFADPSGEHTKPYILNLQTKQYIAVPNADYVDEISWTDDTMTYLTERGYAYYDVLGDSGKAFGEINKDALGNVVIANPIISNDGAYIAYSDGGLFVYSIKTGKSIRLTTNQSDKPALWHADNKTIIFFSSSQTPNEATLSEIHIGTRQTVILADLPQPAKTATWIAREQVARLTLGYDDGSYDYAYDFSNKNLKLFAETSAGVAFTDVVNKTLATFKANTVAVFDTSFTKISEVKRTEKTSVVGFDLATPNLAFFVRENDTTYEAASFDLSSGIETALGAMTSPRAIVAPNGRSAVTVGSKSALFIDIH